MKWVLHDSIRIYFVHLLQNNIGCRLGQRRQKDKLRSYYTVKGGLQQTMLSGLPVAVRRMVILNVSPSMTCAPELGPIGDSRLVIAWIPCNVPARTKYSFEVKRGSPSKITLVIANMHELVKRPHTPKVSFIDQSTSFVNHLSYYISAVHFEKITRDNIPKGRR